ncbi:PDR/VanB family oxidoreductase [Mycobacteroides salmoniphilum]|uniref:PDR/VanB family oxidoreductase n=1 Tax=Mycobacteroides salmoniphilum TaxID=404941 RepID=UPI0009939D68|nr:PDR/VanB family oxidoreductase [Mycobacteroides salmoniphilum]
MVDGRLSRLATALLKPYTGEPPPGLYRANRPDALIRIAGATVPHFISLVMRLGGDRELPELPHAANRRTVRVADRTVLARDTEVVQLALATDDGEPLPCWHPGAHIDVHLPSGQTRQYSLCGDPQQPCEYRIAVRRIEDGSGGSVEMHGLDVGQQVDISDPRNAFMLALPGAASRASSLRFIAGGIGITPILPMVRAAERLGVPWTLCYTGRNRDSLPFVGELLAFGDKVRVRTDDQDGLPCAAELLDETDERTAVYMCGPPLMMQSVFRDIPQGVELHAERFSPPLVADGMEFEVELACTGEVLTVAPQQTALDALRAARPNMGYSCRQGFCGTCVQRVLSGDIEHRDGTLTEQQRAAGHMLVCVSRAVSAGARIVVDL